MSRPPMPLLAGLGCLVAAAALAWTSPPEPRRAMDGPTARLLGPLSSVLASAEWLRFREALHRGDEARAYAIAERALELDPTAVDAWTTLAAHMIYNRGSVEDSPDPEDRRRWILAGLDLLVRGRERCPWPGPLALLEGEIAWSLAERPRQFEPWPGARDELGPRALAALREAAELGEVRAVRTLERLAERARR